MSRSGPGWVAVWLALLAAGLALSDWTWRADRALYDRALQLWPLPADEQIVIVAIDDASIAAIGRWPWPRAVHATLLTQLAQARPRALLLDLLLSESDPDWSQDAGLLAALRAAGPVVLPTTAQRRAGPLLWQDPPEPLRSSVRLAAAEPALDQDGVLRHVFLRSGPPGALRPHAALALLQAGGECLHPALHPTLNPALTPALAQAMPWQRDAQLALRYLGPPGQVRRVAYLDVLAGRVPPAQLQGRYVLIGMTAQGLGDTLATPVNADHRAMPGVEAIAQTLQMLRSGQGLRVLPAPWLALGSALFVAALVGLMGRLGQRGGLLLALGCALLAPLLAVLALPLGWWVSPLPVLLAALLAYPLWSWRQLEHVVTQLDAEIGALTQPASLLALPSAQALGIEQRFQHLHSAGQQLRSARQFFAEVLDGLPSAMLVADARGQVLLGNALAARLFDVGEAQELVGLDLARLLAEFRSEPVLDWALALQQRTGNLAAVEVELAGQGHYVVQWAQVQGGAEPRLIVAIADVGPLKEAERQREEALALVSHDLRSPVASIALLADAALTGKALSDEAPSADTALLTEMRRLAQRALQMSDDFVRLSHAEQVPLQLQPLELDALARELLAELAPRARLRAIELCCEPDLGDPAWQALRPLADRALLARALLNLLDNALRHSPDGGLVTLGLRRAPTLGSHAVALSVSDQGHGLSAAQRKALAQGQALRSADLRGVGLGLRLVQRVALRHGGQLQVAAAERSGCTLELTLSGIP